MTLHAELVIECRRRITNRNVPPECCAHRTCDKRSEFVVELLVNGMPIIVELCEEHASEFELREFGKFDPLTGQAKKD
jgi:hypothetical protein